MWNLVMKWFSSSNQSISSPLFDETETIDRLAVGDAEYVECIHTNGGGVLSFGIGAPICDANFYPNGGESQPGCLSEFFAFDILGSIGS